MNRWLALLAVTAMALASATGAVADDPPVRAKIAFGDSYTPGGGFGAINWTRIEVDVKNIAYEKSVVLHYKASDGTWKDHPLPFMGHYGNRDVFGSHASSTPPTDEFAIRFSVPGQDFWDNNKGANYRIGSFQGVTGGNVGLKQAIARIGFESGDGFVFTTSWFEAEIYIKNLTFHKKVGVRYTFDGGTTWTDAEASYAGKVPATGGIVDNVEIWKVKTPTLNYSLAADSFRFALFYELRDPGPAFGTQYWNNNFGQDYTLPKLDGATIR